MVLSDARSRLTSHSIPSSASSVAARILPKLALQQGPISPFWNHATEMLLGQQDPRAETRTGELTAGFLELPLRVGPMSRLGAAL